MKNLTELIESIVKMSEFSSFPAQEKVEFLAPIKNCQPLFKNSAATFHQLAASSTYCSDTSGRRGQQADEMPQHHFKKRLTVFLTTFKCRFFTSQPSPLKKLWLHSSLKNFHIFSEIQITNCKTEN